MPAWILLALTFSCAFGTTMMAAGTRIGRERTVASLAELIEKGTFRLVSLDGSPVSVDELSSALRTRQRPSALSPTALLAVAVAVACASALLAFLVVRSNG
jgi:hypothetical protein